MVCYCFNYTYEQIAWDHGLNQYSTYLDEIKQKMEKGCDCENLNPSGKCCLPNINDFLKKLDTGGVRYGCDHGSGCC